jgi:hypothetical protein
MLTWREPRITALKHYLVRKTCQQINPPTGTTPTVLERHEVAQ